MCLVLCCSLGELRVWFLQLWLLHPTVLIFGLHFKIHFGLTLDLLLQPASHFCQLLRYTSDRCYTVQWNDLSDVGNSPASSGGLDNMTSRGPSVISAVLEAGYMVLLCSLWLLLTFKIKLLSNENRKTWRWRGQKGQAVKVSKGWVFLLTNCK